MKQERLEEYMENIKFINKEYSQYINKESGLTYPINTPYLLCRVDKLELTKEELAKAKFEMKVEQKDYEMKDVERLVPKSVVTKDKKDQYTITTSKVKAAVIYNVSNQAGIHNSYEDVEEAFKVCNEINGKVFKVLNDTSK